MKVLGAALPQALAASDKTVVVAVVVVVRFEMAHKAECVFFLGRKIFVSFLKRLV